MPELLERLEVDELKAWQGFEPPNEGEAHGIIARNNPVGFIDPDGLDANSCGGRPGQPCSNELPMLSNGKSPYGSNETYLGVDATYMYYWGGDNPWGNIVRSCLVCMHSRGSQQSVAHEFCYRNASKRTNILQSTWGYAVAVFEATLWAGFKPY